MPIMIAIVCFLMTACVLIQSTPPPSAPLSKPIVYVWIGSGSPPSVKSLAQDKEACVHEAEQKGSMSEADRWQTHVNQCMQTKGWGQKAIE